MRHFYWKGYLKLALVSCPIALHAACSTAERICFRQINKATGNRLRHQHMYVTEANWICHSKNSEALSADQRKSTARAARSIGATNVDGEISSDKGQCPSHGPRCDHQYDRGREQQTQQTE
jgi:hypothetical protein